MVNECIGNPMYSSMCGGSDGQPNVGGPRSGYITVRVGLRVSASPVALVQKDVGLAAPTGPNPSRSSSSEHMHAAR